MIRLTNCGEKNVTVLFCHGNSDKMEGFSEAAKQLFQGELLQTAWTTDKEGKLVLLTGMGEPGLEVIRLKELGAAAVKECRAKKITDFSMNIEEVLKEYGVDAVRHITEGAVLGTYEQRNFKEKQEEEALDIELCGISEGDFEEAQKLFQETLTVTEGICFARNMVNLPGNRLRPEDFAKSIIEFVKDTEIETELLDVNTLKEKGMQGLLGVGESSEFPPCLLVLRYTGNPEDSRKTGLVGKGVTCDTGGYCLKPANSMLGIKGDMAGGAAVSGAIYSLAKNKVPVNAVAVIPMCENRISPGSLLPGDVIGSYAGKTIEVANTDAEGRLILADAVSYAVRDEGVTEVLDIATLTGAVVGMFGFTVTGAVCDNDEMYQRFEKAHTYAGERCSRIPFYAEHEKMIESKIADVRNLSSDGCGTITAGLFIRAFAEERPWLHLDIAGTAWVDAPIFAFQSAGATGAGVYSIYRFCCEK